MVGITLGFFRTGFSLAIIVVASLIAIRLAETEHHRRILNRSCYFWIPSAWFILARRLAQ